MITPFRGAVVTMLALATSLVWKGEWGGLALMLPPMVLAAWSHGRRDAEEQRQTVADAILRGARRRLPGAPLRLSSGSSIFEVDGMFLALERVEPGRLRVAVAADPHDAAASARGAARRADGRQAGAAVLDGAGDAFGPRRATVARPDAPELSALREALDGATMTDGVWSIDLDALRYGDVEGGVDDVLAWGARLLMAARVKPSTSAASLTAIAQTDPVPGVRARALLLLATIDPSLTVARQLAGLDGLVSIEIDRVVAAALIAQAEGTGADVPALRAAAARLGASPEREAVELAIEAIQARVGPASVGALSASNLDGELSVAADGGELSLGRHG